MVDQPTFDVVVTGRGEGDVVTLIHLRGELDLASVPELEEVLGAADATRIEVDLSELSFIDSSGAAALVRARQAAEESGRTLRLARASTPVLRVFELLGEAFLLEEEA